MTTAALAVRLLAALPQTQCTRCGYPDCAAYAQAMACGDADINQCPPGGEEGIQRLARISGRPASPLNPAHGVEGPRQLAVIDEAWCIGCTLCIKACPVDCIVGGPKLMHTVINAPCTGCELCIPVCPVDCISLLNVTGSHTGWQAWGDEQAAQAEERYRFHQFRQTRTQTEREQRLARHRADQADSLTAPAQTAGARADVDANAGSGEPEESGAKAASTNDTDRRRTIIDAARQRAKARRQPPG